MWQIVVADQYITEMMLVRNKQQMEERKSVLQQQCPRSRWQPLGQQDKN